MLCPRCGTQIADDAQTCHNCGYEFAKSASSPKETSTFFLRRRRRTQSFSGFPYKAGVTIGGRFDVKDILGIGAFGGTLKVWDRQRQELLALKIFLSDVIGEEGQARLEEVLGQLVRLRHKNLVPIYEYGEDQGHTYALMQLLEGLTLSKIIKLRQNKGEAFNLEEIEPMLSQICDGLMFAQDYVIHGLLTPENILVLPEYLCVTDTGLVTVLPQEPRSRLLARKPEQARYVAPEIKAGQEGDTRSDVYSLGMVLGEMATGQLMAEPVDSLFSLQPEVHPLVDVIYRKATDKSPRARYDSLQMFIADVSAVLHAGELANLEDASTIISASKSHPSVKAVEPNEVNQMLLEAAGLTPPPLPEGPITGGQVSVSSTMDQITVPQEEYLSSEESLVPPALPPALPPTAGAMAPPMMPPAMPVVQAAPVAEEVVAPVMPPPIPEGEPTAITSTEDIHPPSDMPRIEVTTPSSPYALQNAPTPYKTTSPYGVMPQGASPFQPPAVAPVAPPTQPESAPILPTPPPITSPYSAQNPVDSSHLDQFYQEPPDSSLETEIDNDDGRFSRLAIILGVAGVLLMLMALGIALYFKFVYFPQQAYLRKQRLAKARQLNRNPVPVNVRNVTPPVRRPDITPVPLRRDVRDAPPVRRPDTRRPVVVAKKPDDRRTRPAPVVRRPTPLPVVRRVTPRPVPVVRRPKPVVARRRVKPPPPRRRKVIKVAKRRVKPPPRRRRRLPPPPRRRAPVRVAVKPPAARTGSKCPRGMAYVRKGAFRMGSPMSDESRSFIELANVWRRTKAYCIDRYEYPGRGRRPKRSVSWYQAKKLCEAQGKRLCTEKEWERACKGGRNTRYPYGNKFSANRCNTQRKDGSSRSVTSSGRFRSCRSGYGVYDMSGNVAEWTSSRFRNKSWRIIRGGSARRPDWAVRCATRSNLPPSRRKSMLGFRCCANPNP